MKKLWSNYLLMCPEGDGTGAGGTGGSLLTTPQGGGGAAAGAGGANTGAAAGAGAAGSAGASGATGNSGGGATANWRDTLPAELREEASLKIHNDIGSLVKSYIHAQKHIGADKIVVPGKLATDDDWNQVYTKLGLPKDIKEYDVKLEIDSVDKDFVQKFKETSHKAGILPKQAQVLADWFKEVNSSSATEVQKQRETKQTQELAHLKNEWGAAYDQELSRAARVLKEIDDPGMMKFLEETGLGNDVRVIKLFNSISRKFLKEDSTVGGGTGVPNKFTPVQARSEANKIMGDFTHPYHNREHVNHKQAVQEVAEYLNMANQK